MTISLAEQTMNCYIAGGLEGLIPLTRAGGKTLGGTGIEPEKPHASAGGKTLGGLVTTERDHRCREAPPQHCAEGAMASPNDNGIDASAITTSRDFESMLRQLGFSRAFARKATAHGFNAAHSASASDQSADDQAKAALERMRAVAATMRQDENGH